MVGWKDIEMVMDMGWVELWGNYWVGELLLLGYSSYKIT